MHSLRSCLKCRVALLRRISGRRFARTALHSDCALHRYRGSAAFESYDPRDLYYSKFDKGGLWEMPIKGGEEQRIAPAPHLGYWVILR